jgi:photosystem II stability/assembly factor-like uncharacterized protein
MIPATPELIFASRGDTLFRSDDLGLTWDISLAERIYEVVQTPVGTLLSRGQFLWRSVDLGASWEAVTEGFDPDGDGYYPSHIAANELAVLASVNDDDYRYVARSLDDGLTWHPVPGLPDSSYFLTMISDVENRFYFSTYVSYTEGAVVFGRSDDGGETWLELDRLPPSTPPWSGHYPRSLFATSEGRLYAQDSYGAVFVSNNYGESWIRTPGFLPQLRSFVVNQEGYLFAGTVYSGVWRSVDPVLGTSNPITTTPTQIALYQNYPNPFNPVTTIAFDLPVRQQAALTIHNLLGQEIETLFEGDLTAGAHSYGWDGSAHASGIYFYQLRTPSYSETRKLMLVK